MRQAIRTPPPLSQDNVVVLPSAGENRAPHLSRPVMFLGLLAGVLMGILALKASTLFVSSVPPHGRSVQLPAAASQAKSITKGVEANEAAQAQALVRERQRADALATEAVAPQLRQALQGERDRSAALTHELAAARREIETRGVLVTAADRETVEVRQAGEAAALYLQQALEEERKRVVALTRELAASRQEIEARAAMATEAGEVAALRQRQALEEEHERATSLTRELAASRQEIEARAAVATKAAEASQAAATRQQQVLEEERKRVTSLARELAAARQEIEAHATVAAKAAEASQATATRQQQMLEEEHKRVASLTRELAVARQEIEARTALATGTGETGDAAAPRQRQAQEDERPRADVLPGALAAAPRAIDAAIGAAKLPDTRTTHIDTTAAPAHATNTDTGILDRPASADTQVVEAQKLLTRAATFLSQGDISAARTVLERALDMGSAEAGYRLAETYDPLMLSSWRTLGTRGDPAKARELYARAYADGIEQAKDRMHALQ